MIHLEGGAGNGVLDGGGVDLVLPDGVGLVEDTAELGLGALLLEEVEEGELVVHESGLDQIHDHKGEPEPDGVFAHHHPGGQPPGGHGLHETLAALVDEGGGVGSLEAASHVTVHATEHYDALPSTGKSKYNKRK